jgi:hypothetical protein
VTDRLIQVLRDGGSLALTTEEAVSKRKALEDAGFLQVDMTQLPEVEKVDNGYSTQLRIGSVSLKTAWGEGETTQAYIERHMELALDHIAAAKWVMENPPPPPPVYRKERRVLLTWQESEERYPTLIDFQDANHALYLKADSDPGWRDSNYGIYGNVRLLDVREDGDRFLHLFGVEVTRKVRVEGSDDDE